MCYLSFRKICNITLSFFNLLQNNESTELYFKLMFRRSLPRYQWEHLLQLSTPDYQIAHLSSDIILSLIHYQSMLLNLAYCPTKLSYHFNRQTVHASLSRLFELVTHMCSCNCTYEKACGSLHVCPGISSESKCFEGSLMM